MPTRRQPAPGPDRPRTTPHDNKVRHAVGEAAQRRVDDASVGLPDGGDWMAERVTGVQPKGRKTNPA